MILYDVRKYAMESVYVCLLSIMILLWIFHPLQLRKSYEKNEKQKKTKHISQLHNSSKIQWKKGRNRITMYALTCIYMTTHIHRGNMIWNQAMPACLLYNMTLRINIPSTTVTTKMKNQNDHSQTSSKF
jgi:nucleoside recognition membrane protein YjiH